MRRLGLVLMLLMGLGLSASARGDDAPAGERLWQRATALARCDTALGLEALVFWLTAQGEGAPGFGEMDGFGMTLVDRSANELPRRGFLIVTCDPATRESKHQEVHQRTVLTLVNGVARKAGITWNARADKRPTARLRALLRGK
jgi:hypothetical protein